MATITSQADGDWNTAGTWDTGTVPTSSDTVYVVHTVTFAADITAEWVLIFPTGSLIVDSDYALASQITAHVQAWDLHECPGDSDTRTVNLDGVLLDGVVPRIACHFYAGMTYVGDQVKQNDARDVIISDPGYPSAGATLQDIKPEGCARAYTRKVSNVVKSATVQVLIRATMPFYLGRLYKMASSPYQVLLSTDRIVLKGYIESIVPDQSYVGTEYIAVRVTVAEGL